MHQTDINNRNSRFLNEQPLGFDLIRTSSRRSNVSHSATQFDPPREQCPLSSTKSQDEILKPIAKRISMVRWTIADGTTSKLAGEMSR